MKPGSNRVKSMHVGHRGVLVMSSPYNTSKDRLWGPQAASDLEVHPVGHVALQLTGSSIPCIQAREANTAQRPWDAITAARWGVTRPAGVCTEVVLVTMNSSRSARRALLRVAWVTGRWCRAGHMMRAPSRAAEARWYRYWGSPDTQASTRGRTRKP